MLLIYYPLHPWLGWMTKRPRFTPWFKTKTRSSHVFTHDTSLYLKDSMLPHYHLVNSKPESWVAFRFSAIFSFRIFWVIHLPRIHANVSSVSPTKKFSGMDPAHWFLVPQPCICPRWSFDPRRPFESGGSFHKKIKKTSINSENIFNPGREKRGGSWNPNHIMAQVWGSGRSRKRMADQQF